MSIISDELNLVYYDVPKIACTSLKTFFWEVANHKSFALPFALPKFLHRRITMRAGLIRPSIHDIPGYRTKSYAASDTAPEGYETLVVVRDPARKLHSAWKNKVCRSVFTARGELLDLENEGLSPDPDFGTFIDNFELYRAVSRPARVHSHSLSWHLGPKLSAYDHVFRLEESDRLLAFLAERLGRPVKLPHENATHEETRSDRLTPAQQDRLLRITAADYEWLGGLYDPRKSMERFSPKVA